MFVLYGILHQDTIDIAVNKLANCIWSGLLFLDHRRVLGVRPPIGGKTEKPPIGGELP